MLLGEKSHKEGGYMSVTGEQFTWLSGEVMESLRRKQLNIDLTGGGLGHTGVEEKFSRQREQPVQRP